MRTFVVMITVDVSHIPYPVHPPSPFMMMTRKRRTEPSRGKFLDPCVFLFYYIKGSELLNLRGGEFSLVFFFVSFFFLVIRLFLES